MDSNDWRSQVPLDSRHKIVNKIMDTLQKHLQFFEPEGSQELRRIAARFEEKIFNIATSQTDYLRKISTKMLTLETKSQNAAGSSPSIVADSNRIASDLGNLNLEENDDSESSLSYEPPVVNTGDWRNQLPLDSRQKNISKLMETVKKHVPCSGQEGIDELMRIAISFEELIFNTAFDQVDYFRKISLKMQTMEGGN